VKDGSQGGGEARKKEEKSKRASRQVSGEPKKARRVVSNNDIEKGKRCLKKDILGGKLGEQIAGTRQETVG